MEAERLRMESIELILLSTVIAGRQSRRPMNANQGMAAPGAASAQASVLGWPGLTPGHDRGCGDGASHDTGLKNSSRLPNGS
jgi:hypothetical protein